MRIPRCLEFISLGLEFISSDLKKKRGVVIYVNPKFEAIFLRTMKVEFWVYKWGKVTKNL